MVRNGLILLCFVLILSGCDELQEAVNDAKKETTAPPIDKYIVLLDLSDRILYNNQQQVAKDLTVLKAIQAMFRANLNSKDPAHLYYSVNDKLKVLIAPQRTTPRKLYDDAGQLRVELSSEEALKKAAVVDQSEKTFSSVLPELYKQAIISNNNADYVGADIWKYFDEDLSGDIDKDARNTLFIITDGYLDFEKTEDRAVQGNRFTSCAQLINSLKSYPDWNTKFDQGDYGLMPVGKKFSNLKVVLLEINPKPEWNGEYKLLTRIWGKWFSEMGIDNYCFIKNDNINEVKESLEKFMQVKITSRIEPARWAGVTVADSAAVANGAGIDKPLTSLAVKKKDKPVTASSNKRSRPLKKPKSRQDEQVSFGPLYK
ncbi:MAG TPA: hypothetical protein VD993_11980 [Chitinophagaceae bacterium]|nr:hypothetical protein [Chitinophagaceae bacterium]